MRIAEPGEQGGDALQPKNIGSRRERPQPIELRLDGGEDEVAWSGMAAMFPGEGRGPATTGPILDPGLRRGAEKDI